MGAGSSAISPVAKKYTLSEVNLHDLSTAEQQAFGRALKNFVPAYNSEIDGGSDFEACNQFERLLEEARKSLANLSDSPSTGQIVRQKSVLSAHRSSFAIVDDHKRDISNHEPPIKEGDESKKEVSISMNFGSVSPAHYMKALEKGDLRQKSFKDPTGFRQRRGSFSQGIEEDPDNKEVFEQRRTTIYASSEIGLQQSYTAPFPPHVLGTFSCHGIAPAEEAEPDDVMRALMGAGADKSAGKVHQKTNQDRGCVVYPFAGSTTSAFLLVLDGHGDQGDRVAEFAMRQIVLSVETHPQLRTDPMLVLSESFVATNKALVITKEIKAMTSGTTVVAAFMTGNTLYVANVGDSRAVLATERSDTPDKCTAKMLSVDHKPDSPEEYERITKKRGYVSMSRGNESFVSQDIDGGFDAEGNTFDPERLEEQKKKAGPSSCSVSARVWLNPEHTLVGLAMSRSIGDLAVKRVGVIAVPDVFQFEIDPEKDKFLLLASDGVWEFIENQEAVDIVARNLKYGSHTACQMLIEEAEKRWQVEEGDYRDDITALVITLPLPYKATL